MTHSITIRPSAGVRIRYYETESRDLSIATVTQLCYEPYVKLRLTPESVSDIQSEIGSWLLEQYQLRKAKHRARNVEMARCEYWGTRDYAASLPRVKP